MKEVYLDTNILLSILRSAEPIYDSVIALQSKKQFKFYTSTITLIELISVLSREKKLLKESFLDLSKTKGFEQILSLSFEEQIFLIIEYLIRFFNAEILSDPNLELINLSSQDLYMSLSHKVAFLLGSKTGLRSLDNLHFSIVKAYNDFYDRSIEYLITADENFLSKRNDCHSISNVSVIHPETFREVFGF